MLNLRVTLGASASVFALVLMSSVAFAQDVSIDAGADEEALIACEEYPVIDDSTPDQEASPEQIRGVCTDEECGESHEETSEQEFEVLEFTDPEVFQNQAFGGPVVVRQGYDRDVSYTNDSVDFCETAGPGWNWLCGVN